MMKKLLIIHAHPEAHSFCSALSEEIAAYVRSQGAEAQVSDLYRMGFDPVGGPQDFNSPNNPDYFKYQLEQVAAFEKGNFVRELDEEMKKFEWCDTLVFTFPLWWFGLPAILKGWVDRVFAMGFVYGNGRGVYENGFFKEKQAFLCFTTGGPEMAYGASGKNGSLDTILFPIHHGIFYFAGMKVLPPFVSFAPVRKTDDERAEEMERLRKYLEELSLQTPLFGGS